MTEGNRIFDLLRRPYVYAALGLVVVTIPASAKGASLYDFDEAVGRGVVDINFNPSFKRPLNPVIDHLAELDPGIVNRFGFHFGGPDKEFLEQQATLLGQIRTRLPRALMGAVFPQDVFKDYHVILPCDTQGDSEYAAASMKARAPGIEKLSARPNSCIRRDFWTKNASRTRRASSRVSTRQKRTLPCAGTGTLGTMTMRSSPLVLTLRCSISEPQTGD